MSGLSGIRFGDKDVLQPVAWRESSSSASFPANGMRASGLAAPSFTRRVDLLRTVEAVEDIADEWRALQASTPEATGFQSLDWCLAWMRANVDGTDRWRIVVVRDADAAVAIWPLERTRCLGARVVRWLGEPWTQYGDALVADNARRIEHLASAWREITGWSDVDVVKLGRVRDDAALAALPGFRGRTIVHRETAPFIDLRRAGAIRPDKRLRARRRKLESVGPVRFDIVSDAVEREACVRRAIRWKTAWLESRGLASSGLMHPNAAALLTALSTSDTLVIGRLRAGDDVIALELGLQTNAHFRSLLGAHDKDHAYGSPGHLLINHMIEWCQREGRAVYDLMVPADPYKSRWSNDEIAVNDHLIRTRWRGRLAASWFRARPALKALYKRVPDALRQRLSHAVWMALAKSRRV